MINYNRACVTGSELELITEVLKSGKMAGGGYFNKKCEFWFEEHLGCERCLLTPSCTAALEMVAILINIQPGDEVIMPSFTFVSTANAFVIRGAKVVFVDIEPMTMNMDVSLVEVAITNKTKAIVAVHYAGVSCDMEKLMTIAKRHSLYVVEDAAQAMGSSYKDLPVGRFGHLATFSFHASKNITSGGEGGALIINDEALIERAEIIQEKGTDRTKFSRGMVKKYSWIDIGSSYLMSEIQAAYLYAQLSQLDKITDDRLDTWSAYYSCLSKMVDRFSLELPEIPANCKINGHIFYVKLIDATEREKFLKISDKRKLGFNFHYVPLHNSKAGLKYGRFEGRDVFTSKDSERLVRFPIWYGMPKSISQKVIKNFVTNLA